MEESVEITASDWVDICETILLLSRDNPAIDATWRQIVDFYNEKQARIEELQQDTPMGSEDDLAGAELDAD
jgi:hypothetical protein